MVTKAITRTYRLCVTRVRIYSLTSRGWTHSDPFKVLSLRLSQGGAEPLSTKKSLGCVPVGFSKKLIDLLRKFYIIIDVFIILLMKRLREDKSDILASVRIFLRHGSYPAASIESMQFLIRPLEREICTNEAWNRHGETRLTCRSSTVRRQNDFLDL